MVRDGRVQDRAGVGSVREAREVQPGEQGRDRTRPDDASRLEDDRVVGEPGDLRQGVRDVEDRQARLVAQALEEGQDLGLAGRVEGRQRLVHEEEARLRHQGPADRDALALAAREAGDAPPEQTLDAQHGDHGVERQAGLAARREDPPEQEVPPHAEMREEPRVLEHVADAAAMRRQPDARLRVGQHRAVGDDPGALGPDEARDRVDEGRLARSRRAEDRRDAGRRLEGGVEPERALPMRDRDGERHAAIRRATRRASHSDRARAASDTTTEISVRRIAPASPPGTCVRV